MTLRQLITIVLIATIICWLTWGMVLVKINPEDAGLTGFILFYSSLFFSLLGVFFLVSFGWRRLFAKFTLDYKIVSTSFRQSIFFALLIIGVLFLQSKELLTWWNVMLIVTALAVVEGFFLSIKRQS